MVVAGAPINIEAQIITSSGGVNYDAAFFAIGDGWANYSGNNYGIVFRNGIVDFFEDNGIQNMAFKDTIGTYVSGEMISFTLTFNNDGTLTVQGNSFSGTFTPTTVVQNAKWIIASKDSKPYQGFYVKSVNGNPVSNTYWDGNKWSGNVNGGAWFPSTNTLTVFGIDDYSWGEIRTKDLVVAGAPINIEAQIITSSGGVNYDAAFFAIGDGWANYSGNNYGIVFRNGIVDFFEDNGIQNMAFKDTIGTYVSGEMISFTLTFNNDGTLTVQGNNFSGTFTPTTVVQNAKWIMASKDSKPYQGFYVKGNPVTDIENESNTTNIVSFRLSQNYPNPFNPTTMIQYSIPKTSMVSIKVYDILGRQVETLVNGQKVAGNYSVQFNGSNLSSGIYFYRIESGDFVQTKKLVLLK